MKAIKNIFQFVCLGASVSFFGHAISTRAAIANVSVINFAFSPPTTNILVNDTVIWTWPTGSTSHNVFSTSTPQLWTASAIANGPFTFTNKFTTTGSFPYKCTVHGFTGSIVVAAAGPPTVTVMVGDSLGDPIFSPAITNVPINTKVIWNWVGSFHSTTSGDGSTGTPDGLWDSGVNNPAHAFTNTFNTAGTFSYYCSIHYPEKMVGSIIVTNLTAPINVPPTVTITNPASGIVLSAPASLTLKANAADSDGSVTNVKFLQGTTLLGNVATAPFSFTVNNLAAASYTFSAIASDNGGATATNSITVSVIAANPVAVTAPVFASANHFKFSYSSDIGLSYVVQVSTNLLNWNPVITNKATVNSTLFTDPNANNSGSFYRVGRLPNP